MTLRSKAANEGRLTSLSYADSGGYATSAEFMIADKWTEADRVHGATHNVLTKTLPPG